MLAMMSIVKSFLFGEDLVHWQINADSQSPFPVAHPDCINYNAYHRVQIEDNAYLYYDATNYQPQDFNQLATRISDMQVFGTAFIITRKETDFLAQCRHAPELPESFRLQHPAYPCTQ